MKITLLLPVSLVALCIVAPARHAQRSPFCKTSSLKLRAVSAEVYADRSMLDLWKIPADTRVMVVTLIGTIGEPCPAAIGNRDFAAVNGADRDDYYESFGREWTCGSHSSPLAWGGSAPVEEKAVTGGLTIRAFFIVPVWLLEFDIVDISQHGYATDPRAGSPSRSLGRVKL